MARWAPAQEVLQARADARMIIAEARRAQAVLAAAEAELNAVRAPAPDMTALEWIEAQRAAAAKVSAAVAEIRERHSRLAAAMAARATGSPRT